MFRLLYAAITAFPVLTTFAAFAATVGALPFKAMASKDATWVAFICAKRFCKVLKLNKSGLTEANWAATFWYATLRLLTAAAIATGSPEPTAANKAGPNAIVWFRAAVICAPAPGFLLQGNRLKYCPNWLFCDCKSAVIWANKPVDVLFVPVEAAFALNAKFASMVKSLTICERILFKGARKMTSFSETCFSFSQHSSPSLLEFEFLRLWQCFLEVLCFVVKSLATPQAPNKSAAFDNNDCINIQTYYLINDRGMANVFFLFLHSAATHVCKVYLLGHITRNRKFFTLVQSMKILNLSAFEFIFI